MMMARRGGIFRQCLNRVNHHTGGLESDLLVSDAKQLVNHHTGGLENLRM